MTGYVGPIEQIAVKNKYFRQVLFTGKHLQLVVMSSTRRSHLPITGFMWTPYLPVRDRTQTGTRRSSCHEPRNRNRDAAWMVISPFFRSKRRLSVNLGLDPPCIRSGLYQPGTPSSTGILRPST